ncbi:MAG: DsbA family protein, partial [Pseudomonadales bacterium]
AGATEVAAKLKVYVDYKSPYAYIAKDPTYQLEEEFGIEIDWYPLTLNIGSFLGTARQDDAGKVVESNRSPRQWLVVKYAYKDARRYGKLRGLTVRGTQKIWDTSIAHIGFLWAKAQGHDVLKRYMDITYERFWKRELDLEDPSVVQSVLTEAGAHVNGFADYLQGEGRQLHDQLQDEILDKGYYGVPTYVIDDTAYFGREHLPRVRWHLRGGAATGEPPPDIAYDTVLA